MKAIFLDRDGVINKDPGGWTKHNYVTDPKDLHFIPGSLEALKILKNNGYKAIIVSNQGGIAKGYFSMRDLEKVHNKMMKEIHNNDGDILESFYCVHKDDDNCRCRKPKTGLLEDAVKKYGLNPRNMYFIGDSHVDITAGKIMGSRTIFLLSGKYSEAEMNKWKVRPHHVFSDLLSAVKWIIGKDKRKAKRAIKRES